MLPVKHSIPIGWDANTIITVVLIAFVAIFVGIIIFGKDKQVEPEEEDK